MADSITGKKVKVEVTKDGLLVKFNKRLLKELEKFENLYYFEFDEGIVLAKHKTYTSETELSYEEEGNTENKENSEDSNNKTASGKSKKDTYHDMYG